MSLSCEDYISTLNSLKQFRAVFSNRIAIATNFGIIWGNAYIQKYFYSKCITVCEKNYLIIP